MFPTDLTQIKRMRANLFGRLSNLLVNGSLRRSLRYVPALEHLEARRLLSFNLFSGNGARGAITLGPDGNLWFTNALTSIGRFSPDGAITSFTTPTSPRFGFGGITAGPDGNVWFTESRGELNQPSLIGRITPDGTITEFSDLRVNSFTGGIATGVDGNLWFTTVNHTGSPFQEVERITPDGTVTEFPNALGGGAITEGPDGNIWFAAVSGQIGRITPDGTVTTFNFPRDSITAMTAGPDGNIWALGSSIPGLSLSTAVVRVTPDGVATAFPLREQNEEPLGGITGGSDGNVWFTVANQLGQITPNGTITEIPIPSNSFIAEPGDLTTGFDGNLWFTAGSQIGQFVLDGITTTPTTTHLSAPVTAVAGQPVTLTATVTSSAGVPDGTVLFVDNGTFLGSTDLDGSGQATFTASFDAGFHAVSALYAGTPAFAPSGDIRGIQVSADSPDAGLATPDSLSVIEAQQVGLALGASAVDTHFAATHRETVNDAGHQSTAVTGAAALAARQTSTAYTPPAQRTTTAAVPPVRLRRDGIEATFAATLAGPLAPDSW